MVFAIPRDTKALLPRFSQPCQMRSMIKVFALSAKSIPLDFAISRVAWRFPNFKSGNVRRVQSTAGNHNRRNRVKRLG